MYHKVEITSSTEPGVLDALTLHPQTLPLTPYATECANYTHRIEHRWQVKAYCTAALTTGTRVGFMVLPDPTMVESVEADMVWSACENGMGLFINSTGLSSRNQSFTVRSATRVLSNSNPAAGESHLGYSGGTGILYLLEKPHGIGDTERVNVTVLTRCLLEVKNPIPGFALRESGVLAPKRLPPGPAAWKLTVSYTQQNDGGKSKMNSGGQKWAVYHTGNIPLAGGWYFCFHNVGKTMPVAAPSSQQYAAITGDPEWGRVYVADQPFPTWQNNRRQNIAPTHFAVAHGGISGYVYMIGFISETQAANQVENRWTSIPGGAELCIRYAAEPTWANFHAQTSSSQLDINFWPVYTSGSVRSIYSNGSPLSRAGAATYALEEPRQLHSMEELVEGGDDTEFETTDDEDYPDAPACACQGACSCSTPSAPQLPYSQFTPDELAEQYARACQLVEDLEEEYSRRETQPTLPLPQAVPTRHRSWWDMLKAGITARRKHLA